MFTQCQHTPFSSALPNGFNLHGMNEDISPDMQRFFLAAMKHTSARTWADIGRLINETDQNLTNWKRRGIPENKLLSLAEFVNANPYWIRDGGDIPMINVYKFDKDTEDLLRVSESLPPNYKRFLIQEGASLAELAANTKNNGTK